jgi:hypothetical protein
MGGKALEVGKIVRRFHFSQFSRNAQERHCGQQSPQCVVRWRHKGSMPEDVRPQSVPG